jgi:outer membrane protein OmpA-like peptidoglycan-associated protein
LTRPRVLAALFALILPDAASAMDRSLDTQLVQPVMMPGSLLVVDTPRVPIDSGFIGGAAWQVEHLPLEYFENTLPAGAAIAARNTLHLVAAYPLVGRVVLGGRWSAALMDPGVEPSVAPAHNLAAGDLGLFARLAMIQGERFALGPRLDLWLPVGTEDSWVSERAARYAPVLLAEVDLRVLRLHGSVGALLRSELATDWDFALDSELTLGLGARVPFGDEWSGLVELGSHHGMSNLMKPGAENPLEVKAGARWRSPTALVVDVAAGTAASHGYGAADFRLLVAVSRVVPPPEREPEPEPVVVVAPPRRALVQVDETLPDQKAEVAWKPEQLAQVHRGRIVIREPLQFELDTATLLPESVPTLEAVAKVMTDYPQIELLIIEGHASEEGSFEHNYELSNLRATAVYGALLEAGVRPERLSYRALGEIVPVAPGDDEESRARNRRVEFHIVKVRDYLDVGPEYGGGMITLPWNGERVPEPRAGDKLLSAEAHPILLEEEYVDQPAPAETIPDQELFRPGFDDEEPEGDPSEDQEPNEQPQEQP